MLCTILFEPVSAGSAGHDEVLPDQGSGAQELLLVSRQLLNDGGHPAVQHCACYIPSYDPEMLANHSTDSRAMKNSAAKLNVRWLIASFKSTLWVILLIFAHQKFTSDCWDMSCPSVHTSATLLEDSKVY